MPATYEGGVLKLRWPLPLPASSEVMVTVESVEKSPVEVAEETVVWPDLSERLREIYGDQVLPENPVLAARNDERY
ncbi:MAG: hypothetical protein ACREFX_03165 [Opitutaceae bacterium]